MRHMLAALLIVLGYSMSSSTPASMISQTNFATPTSLTYNVSSVSLVSESGNYVAVVSTPFTVTFKRTDADFASTTLADIAVPLGRFTNVSVCQSANVIVKLDAVKFDGKSTSKFAYGSTIYTTKADNSIDSISTTGTAVDLTFSNPNTGCSSSLFPNPLCVTDSTQSGCRAGDTVYTSTGQVANSKGAGKGDKTGTVTLKLNLMVDLYDSVVLDGATGQVAQTPNLLPLVGDPGAAIHLSKADLNGAANVSMIFGSDKTLLTLSVGEFPGGAVDGYVHQLCSGTNNVANTGTSSSPVAKQFSYISTTDSNGMGKIQAPMSNVCTDLASCNSNGVNVITGYIQAVGSNATAGCIADSAATPPSLGYTYSGGAGYIGGAGASATLPVVRIVDPNSIFGTCTSGYILGHTGTCASAAGDGYY